MLTDTFFKCKLLDKETKRHQPVMTNRTNQIRPTINAKRLIDRHKAIARIGATGRGGVNRQALTLEDGHARQRLLAWSNNRGYSASIDPIGNLFIRKPGLRDDLAALMTGSHLDTQPTGGNFDGIFGVLAAFEALETLEDASIVTTRPIDLVVWMNEEGCRFAPATMGSAVAVGALPLEAALNTLDRKGTSVRDALKEHMSVLPSLGRRDLGIEGFAFLEAHIEQGPVLESEDFQIGVVTSIQGMCVYEVEINGFEAHAGTTPSRKRQDAFMTAVSLVHKLRDALQDPDDVLRFTIGRFNVSPGSPNTVPGHVSFSIDLRHPDAAVLERMGCTISAWCSGTSEGCSISSRLVLRSDPVQFHPGVTDTIRRSATLRKVRHMDIVSGATHDSRYVSTKMPTAMIFVPCEKGISHNEAENVQEQDLVSGAQILCDTLLGLADAEL